MVKENIVIYNKDDQILNDYDHQSQNYIYLLTASNREQRLASSNIKSLTLVQVL